MRKTRRKIIHNVVNKLVYYKHDLRHEIDNIIWDATMSFEDYKRQQRSPRLRRGRKPFET
jgi:hypothetical protein